MAADHPIRLVSKLFQESQLETSPIDNKVKEPTMVMVVNKENSSADLNTDGKSDRQAAVDKDLPVNDSSSSETRAFSPRPTATLTGFNLLKGGNQSPPRTNISSTASKASSSSSAAMSPTYQSPLITNSSAPPTGLDNNPGNKSPVHSRLSAFNLTGQGESGHLLSQHLMELNQMRPSPPYKFFQENPFYQSRQLLNGADLSEFKLNVQLKEKQVREAFATASEATSEEVVVDGNDDDCTRDSQRNAVS